MQHSRTTDPRRVAFLGILLGLFAEIAGCDTKPPPKPAPVMSDAKAKLSREESETRKTALVAFAKKFLTNAEKQLESLKADVTETAASESGRILKEELQECPDIGMDERLTSVTGAMGMIYQKFSLIGRKKAEADQLNAETQQDEKKECLRLVERSLTGIGEDISRTREQLRFLGDNSP